MEPIFKIPAIGNVARNGLPTLQQLELHGRADHYYILRFCQVFACNLSVARWIQREWRATGSLVQTDAGPVPFIA